MSKPEIYHSTYSRWAYLWNRPEPDPTPVNPSRQFRQMDLFDDKQ